MKTSNKQKTLKIVQLALLTALIVVLQWFGSFLTGITGLPMSLVLIPIVIGAFLLGPKEGAFLGIMFGIMTIVMGFTGMDAFTAILFNNFGIWKCIATIAICLVKAGLAGFGAGLVYKLLNKAFKGKYIVLSTVLASVTAPIINTGIFVLGMLLFFFNDMGAIQNALGITETASAVYFIFIGLAGINFVVEFLINLVVSPAIVRIVAVVSKKLSRA
ncbi:MAG: ECF transporter S component [Clostridia bacterium]|nr:ECF transporter S component [Clostridia bacterium]